MSPAEKATAAASTRGVNRMRERLAGRGPTGALRRGSTMLLPMGAILAGLVTACAPSGAEHPVPGVGDLVTSMEVQVGAESVRLLLHATNPTDEPIELDFSSGQRFDFVVRDRSGVEVWRWSEDRAFTQAIGSERIEPGETLTYEAIWDPDGRSGTFEAEGRIVARARAVEQETTFAVPPRAR